MRKIAMLVGVVALMSVVVASVALAAGQHSAGQPKAARRQRLPYLLSAVKLLEDAPELGSELRKGYVITNQHWQRIVEKSSASHTALGKGGRVSEEQQMPKPRPGCGQAATVRRITQRHLAIRRSLVKPNSSNRVSGPVCR
jgi:hypothetical protein